MTLHFIHIGKTGGSAIKHILRRSKNAHWPGQSPEGTHETPYGRIVLHPHRYRLKDVPDGELAFFCLRDPIDRFFSAWYSRENEGRPRYFIPWSDEERRAYELLPTPQALAAALASEDQEVRQQGTWALDNIIHMKPMWRKLVRPKNFDSVVPKIAYIAKQETLDQDFDNLKQLLNLPERLHLPRGKAAHKRTEPVDKSLDDAARAALRRYYAKDYALIELCDELRYDRGWAQRPVRRPGILGKLLKS